MRPHKELADDAVLLAYAATSDESYFAELYERYWTPLVKYFNKTWPGRPAEDLAQDTFMRVMKYAESYRGGSVKSWLWLIAVRQNYDNFNGDEHNDRLDDGFVGDSRLEVRLEAKDEVETLLDILPTAQREAVRNYYIDGGHSNKMNRSRGFRTLQEFVAEDVTKTALEAV